jgi:hypothetical protein
MTVLSTIAALQDLHAGVEGVTSAPTEYPSSLQSAMLPCVLVLPGEGTIDLESIAAKKRADTIYRVYVYVAAVAEGTPVNEGVQTAILLMDRLRDLYLTPANIALTTGTYQAVIKTASDTPIRHSGIGVLSFGEKSYRGFTFDVGIREKW